MRNLLTSTLFKKIFIIGSVCLLFALWGATYVQIETFRKNYIESLTLTSKGILFGFEQRLLTALVWDGDFVEVSKENRTYFLEFFSSGVFVNVLTQIGVLDTAGQIITHTSSEKIDQQLPHALFKQLNPQEIVTVKTGNSYDTYLPFVYQDKLHGYFVVGFTEALVEEGIQKIVRNSVLITIIVLLIAGIIFAISISRFITSPLNAIVQKIHYITASGDLSTQIKVHSQDEIQELADHFNQMTIELVKKEDILKAKNKELKRLDLLKDEFLANTSHELRTPLNGIIGLGESLLGGIGGTLTEEQRYNLTLIVQGGIRLSHLINDILDFSKMKHQNLHLQLETVDIYSVTEIVIALLRPLVEQKDLQLINNVSETLPLVVADANRLRQVLLNLTGNAIKFTEQGHITVTALEQEQFIQISVADTGIGIPKEKQTRIFESFEQADGSINKIYGGTGLGLSIAKSFITMHGGTIEVESAEGQGSTFSFTIPVAQDQTEENLRSLQDEDSSVITHHAQQSISNLETEHFVKATQSPPTTVHFEQPTILIVDDEPVNIQVLKNFLTLNQYQTISALDGFQALEMIEAQKPDLVLLDLMMPRLSGYQVCERIRKNHSITSLPIIILTAKNQPEDLVEGLHCGANDYLPKPFNKDELLARVRTHLALSQVHLALIAAKSRLELILASTKELAASRIKRACIEEVSNAILRQISSQPSEVRFAYWEEGDEQRYVAFKGNAQLNGKEFTYLSHVEKVESFLGTDRLIVLEDGSAFSQLTHCSFRDHQLRIPIWQRDQLLGYIEIEGIAEKDIKQEYLEFVDTLSQSLAITLENLSFMHDLEFKVDQKTEQVKQMFQELEQQHEQLKMAQSQLVQSEKMASLGTLVAGVAHEINNPSNFTQAGAQNMERHLKGLEEFIQELVEDDRKAEVERVFAPKFKPLYSNLKAILEGAHRISAIVKNLRTFSRVESSEQRETDIVESIQSTLNLVEPSYREHVEFVCSFEERARLICWPSQLNQVFMNILVNGCQAIVQKKKQQDSKDVGIITIQTFIQKGSFGIRFQDTGSGIPEDVCNRIFDPFFTTKETGEGTGLGLSISYSIIEKHQGSIQVESIEGEGSTFTIMLPLS